MSEKSNRFEKVWAEAVSKVWNEGDAAFRHKLLTNPKAAFAELGAEIPEGVDLRVIESSRQNVYFVLPPKPEDLKDIEDQNLDELYRACPGTVCQ
jgi:hypothetical protein